MKNQLIITHGIPQEWDELLYLEQNTDVKQAIAEQRLNSGWQHYQEYGQFEKRLPAWKEAGFFWESNDFAPFTRHCFDPWHYLEIMPNHELKPCCKYESLAQWTAKGDSIAQLRDAQSFQSLRKMLLQGYLSEICGNCHIRPIIATADFRAAILKKYPQIAKKPLIARPLKHLRLDITTRCNLRCVYCAVSQPWYVGEDMPETSFAAIFDLLKEQPRKLDIMVNGHGETTFHKEWLTLCNGLIQLDYHPTIITNLAKKLNAAEIQCFAQFKAIQISLDTVDEQLLSELRRQVKLSTIVENINQIRAIHPKKSPQFLLSCGVFDLNYTRLEAVADFAIQYKMQAVTFWQLDKHEDIAKGLNVYPIRSLNPERVIEARHYLTRTIAKLRQAKIAVEIAGDFLQEWHHDLSFAIAGIVRDEYDYLLEWIAWHLEMGFKTFFIADNGSHDGTLQLLEALEQLGIVKLSYEPPRKHAQLATYRSLLARWGAEVDAIAFIDADEFIVSENELTVVAQLQKIMTHEKVGAVAINWRIFGSNGHLQQQDGLVIERFQQGMFEEERKNCHIKTIIKPGAVKRFHVHCADLLDNFDYVDCNGKLIQFLDDQFQPTDKPQGLTTQVTVSPLRIHHYVIKSFQEYTEKKRKRGDAMEGQDYDRGESYFIEHDINEFHYPQALKCLPQLKQRLLELETQLKKSSHFYLSLKGNVRVCNQSTLHGWLCSPEQPQLRLSVNIFINAIFKIKIPAFHYRANVKERGLSMDGFCGFEYTFEPPLNAGDIVTISVYANRYQFPKNRFVI